MLVGRPTGDDENASTDDDDDDDDDDAVGAAPVGHGMDDDDGGRHDDTVRRRRQRTTRRVHFGIRRPYVYVYGPVRHATHAKGQRPFHSFVEDLISNHARTRLGGAD